MIRAGRSPLGLTETYLTGMTCCKGLKSRSQLYGRLRGFASVCIISISSLTDATCLRGHTAHQSSGQPPFSVPEILLPLLRAQSDHVFRPCHKQPTDALVFPLCVFNPPNDHLSINILTTISTGKAYRYVVHRLGRSRPPAQAAQVTTRLKRYVSFTTPAGLLMLTRQ